MRWIKRDSKTASERLAENSDLEKKLTAQLQATKVLPVGTDLKQRCSGFKNLGDCVATIHVSHNLGLEFNCLKWDLTGVQPKGNTAACAPPPYLKAMSLVKAIQHLKPDVDAKAEARNARRQAHADISDASS